MSEGGEAQVSLKKHWFNILLALADGAQHGYAIRGRVRDQTNGRTVLYPATLYGSIRDMVQRRLIEPADDLDQGDPDRRRRYYRLTRLGNEALRSETHRMQALVDAARASQALGGV